MNKFVLENDSGDELPEIPIDYFEENLEKIKSLALFSTNQEIMMQHYKFLYKLREVQWDGKVRSSCKGELNAGTYDVYRKLLTLLTLYNFNVSYLSCEYGSKFFGGPRFQQYLLLNYKNEFEKLHDHFERDMFHGEPPSAKLSDKEPNPEMTFYKARKECKEMFKSFIENLELYYSGDDKKNKKIDSFVEFEINQKDKIKVANIVLGSILMNSLKSGNHQECGAMYTHLFHFLNLNTDNNEEKFKKILEKRRRKEQWSPEYDKLEKYYNKIYKNINEETLSEEEMVRMVSNDIQDYHRIFLDFECGFPNQKRSEIVGYELIYGVSISLNSFDLMIGQMLGDPEQLNDHLPPKNPRMPSYFFGKGFEAHEALKTDLPGLENYGELSKNPVTFDEQRCHVFVILSATINNYNIEKDNVRQYLHSLTRIKHSNHVLQKKIIELQTSLRPEHVGSWKNIDMAMNRIHQEIIFPEHLNMKSEISPAKLLKDFNINNPNFGIDAEKCESNDTCCIIQ